VSIPWADTERGPTCACGMPTYVSFVIVAGKSLPVLVCFAHAGVGAKFALPLERPEKWPSMSTEEMVSLLERGDREHGLAAGAQR